MSAHTKEPLLVDVTAERDHLRAVNKNLLAQLENCLWLLRDLQPEPGLVQQQAVEALARARGAA